MKTLQSYSADALVVIQEFSFDLDRLDLEHERELEALEGDLCFGICDEERTRAVARIKAEHKQRLRLVPPADETGDR
jgi:hypothetical protein